MTTIAIPIRIESQSQALAAINQAVKTTAEILELRFDYHPRLTPERVVTIIEHAKTSGKLLIATCRPTWEGGHFSGQENDRLTLLIQAVKAGVDYVDIELLAVEKNPDLLPQLRQTGSATIILSHHDFECLPADLDQRFERIQTFHPDIHKIAYQAHTITDNFAALDLMHTYGNRVIAMAMDQAGLLSRLLAKKLGSFLTFASLTDGAESAPGQVSFEQINHHYRWESINRDTALFGVIGCPVAHSMSPAIHNSGFDAMAFNALYLPLLVDDNWDSFTAFLDGLRQRNWLHFRGASVTIPHKDHALRYVKQAEGILEPLAERIGAVNTIIVDDKHKLYGYNTDYTGALDAVTNKLAIQRTDLNTMRVAVFGAGGVSRAVVAGFCDCGAKVTIYNRTVAKAKRLAEEFGCAAADAATLPTLDADIVVNCTSLGMTPNIETTPVKAEWLNEQMIVFDTVYNPIETRLLKDAKTAGAKTVDGVGMFVAQAAAQFKLFTQQQPPLDLMRQVLLDHLL